MKQRVKRLFIRGSLTVVATVVAGYLGGIPFASFAAAVGLVLFNVARSDSDRKFSGGVGYDDYGGGHDGGHDGGHGGDHGGDGGGSG